MLKMLSDTRWESKVNSVEPLRYQVAAVREALGEVRGHTKDPVIKIEARFLSEEVGHTASPFVQWCGMTCCARYSM